MCVSVSLSQLSSASCGSWQPQKCCVPILLVILTPPTRKQLELAPAFALSNFPIESAPDSHSQLRCLFVSTNSLLVCFFSPSLSLFLSLFLSVSLSKLSRNNYQNRDLERKCATDIRDSLIAAPLIFACIGN